MGIWIRSQEKLGLINCSDINVGTNCGSICVWGSISDLSEDIGTILGTYHTEAEAIAVLDEIEEFLKGPNAREIFTGEYPKAFHA